MTITSRSIHYVMGRVNSLPTGAAVEAPCAYRVTQPNGVRLYVTHWLARPPASDNPFNPYLANRITFEERVGSTTGPLINTGVLNTVSYTTSSSIPVLEVRLGDAYDVLPGYPNTAGHYWTRRYHYFTQDLLWELKSIYPKPDVANLQLPDLAAERRAIPPSWNLQRVETTKEYNFTGNPLEQSVVESSRNATTNAWTTSPAKAVSYAYWGADKYFQQRAVRTKTGALSYRYAFTDYHDANAAQGMKGQVKATFDAKHATYSIGTNWKYDIQPASGSYPVAEFPLAAGSDPGAYDLKGRVVRVRKLSKLVSGTATYVETQTVYGADTDGSWGQASQMTEAYGTSVARTTNTLAYTADGKISQIQDTNGRVFLTNYGADGEINSVTRTDVSPVQTIASYTYGTSGITNGQATQVVDGLSGTTISFAYSSAGGGLGQVSSVNQTGGGVASYSVGYVYNPAGERARATYNTTAGVTKWGYSDYVRVGNPVSGTRAFQTLVKLDGSDNPTPEELQYAFDSVGRLTNAVFAQTPQASTAPFYTQSLPAATRARSYYDYSPSGKPTFVKHWWDSWNGSTYTSPDFVFESTASYDSYKGLKTSQTFDAPGSNPGFDHTETFGYETERDFLTTENYGDSLPNSSAAWTYDASQNRSNAGYAYDQLNRMTASPGATYTHDAMGNRTARLMSNPATYGWDAQNRMTSYSDAASTVTYTYRNDGLRIGKSKISGSASIVESSRYDGTTSFEQESYLVNGTATVVRSALGARGVDVEEVVTGSHTTAGGVVWGGTPSTAKFPLYDLNGNRVCGLTRSGISYTVDGLRTYDAWGKVRLGSQTGGSPQRYCASVGHVQDDESSLMYMRARYYEPSTGRFVSEDPSSDGTNWYVYASNIPTTQCDVTGEASEDFPFYHIMVNLGKVMGVAFAPIFKIVGKLMARGIMAVATYLGNVGASLFATGLAQVEVGYLELRSSMFGGSAGQVASGSAALGIGFCLSGAKNVAAGVTLLGLSYFLTGMALIAEAE